MYVSKNANSLFNSQINYCHDEIIVKYCFLLIIFNYDLYFKCLNCVKPMRLNEARQTNGPKVRFITFIIKASNFMRDNIFASQES